MTWGVALGVAIGAGGCGGDGGTPVTLPVTTPSTPSTPGAPSTPTTPSNPVGAQSGTRLRTLNALQTTLGSVTFRVGSTTFTSAALGYGTATSYSAIGSVSNVPVTITTNNSAATGTTTVLQQTASFAANTPYTLIAAGIAGKTDTTKPQLLVLADSFPTLPTNTAGLRIVNAAVGSGALSVINTVGTIAGPLTGGASLAYGSVSQSLNGSAYLLLSTGATYNLSVRDGNGALLALPQATAASISNLKLIPGQEYTLFLFGSAGTVTGSSLVLNARLVRDN